MDEITVDIANYVKNSELPPVEVRHQDLERFDDSEYKSKCPVCENGMLLMERDMVTLKLKSRDICFSCGRRVIYTDLVEEIYLKYKFKWDKPPEFKLD